MVMNSRGFAIVLYLAVAVVVYGFAAPPSCAEWEVGLRSAYNSNVDHSIQDPRSDSCASAYVSYAKGVKGESRLNWAFDGNLEGAGYFRNSDLSYGELTLAPALVYFLKYNWAVSVSPFAQAKAVADSDQSAVTLGGKINMRERLNDNFYLSQYYLYRNSTASSTVYSTWEHALGAVFGVYWTKRFSTEVGYEYSYGDAFRSLSDTTTLDARGSLRAGSSAGARTMRGSHPTFSSTFDTVVFRERVNRHSVGITLNLDWTKSLCSSAGYTYSTMKGDSGTSRDHAGSIGLGYRF